MAIADLTRRVMNRARLALARQERAGRGPQPVELIPGMPAAPEPCLLPAAHWSAGKHPALAIAQPKIDGIRALYVRTRVITRQALPFDAALHCLPALARLEERMGEPMVFDGEYQEPEGFEATIASHKRGCGSGIFWLFDAVRYSEWAANRFVEPLEARLERVGEAMRTDDPFLAWLPPVSVARPADVLTLADAAWAAGAEGLVVKRSRDPYHRGRSESWLKLKRDITLDGVVLDIVVPDDNDPAGIVLLVRLDGRSHKIAAMPKHLRELALTEAITGGKCLTGKMVEITFNERTEKGALRGARIVRLREDRHVAS